jgi:hypothetical protein
VKKPLPLENQTIKLKELAGGFYYMNKMENCLFTSKNGSSFELKVFKCPVSLIKG